MIPEQFHDFFVAICGAAGALIGLLFVAISVAARPVVGPTASILEQARASSALSAFLTPLVLALVALMPATNVGYYGAGAGVVGLVFVAATVRRVVTVQAGERRSEGSPPTNQQRSLSILVGFSAAMLTLVAAGIALVLRPHLEWGVYGVATACVVLLTLGIDRAWEMVGARQRGVGVAVVDLFRGERAPGGTDGEDGP